MNLVCKKCNSEIKAENISIQKKMGHCPRCNELTPIDGILNSIETRPVTSAISEIKLNGDSIGLLFPLRKEWEIIFKYLIYLFGIPFCGSPLIVALNVFAESNGDFDFESLASLSLFLIIGLIFISIGLVFMNMKTSLIVSSASIRVARNLYGKEFAKEIKNNQSVMVKRVFRFDFNDEAVYSAKISNNLSESLIVGLDLSPDDTAWIEFVIKSKLK